MFVFFIVFSGALFDMGAVFTDFVTHPGIATLFLGLNRIFWLSFVLASTYGMIHLVYLYEASKAKSFIGKLVEKTDFY